MEVSLLVLGNLTQFCLKYVKDWVKKKILPPAKFQVTSSCCYATIRSLFGRNNGGVRFVLYQVYAIEKNGRSSFTRIFSAHLLKR